MKNFPRIAPLLLTLLAGCASQPTRQPASVAASVPEPVSAPADSTRAAHGNTEASAEYHFSLAQAYVAEGNPDRAIEEYKLTLMFDPHSPLVYARLATEYVKKGMLSAAMDACKEALKQDAKFVDARLMLAGLYSAAHENGMAMQEYERVLKIDPKHEEAAVYKSQLLVEQGKGADAIGSLASFLKKNSESVLAWYYQGRAQQHEKRYDDAVKSYRKAMALRTGFTQAALALGFLYEERHMTAQAVLTYKELFDDAQDVTAANRLSTIYLKEEKYALAVPYLEAIQAADPEDMGARVKLGLIQMELKNYDKAIATFQAILKKAPDSDRIHYYLGSLYEETKQTDQAIEHLKAIPATSKLYADAAMHVAFLLKQATRTAESRTFIQDSIAKSPEISGFYVFEASLQEEAKDIAGAVGTLEKAARKFPDDEKIRYYLGSLYDRQGEVDKGLEQMESILKTNPDNVDALNYIGYTWTVKGMRLNDAEKLLKRALKLRPENGYVQDSWGWYLFTRGRLGEAVVELEKAAKLKPNEPTILEHLADAYVRSNLREKALLFYGNASKLAEDDASKRKLEGKMQTLRGGSDSERMPAGK